MVVDGGLATVGDLVEDHVLHGEERAGARRGGEPLDAAAEVLDDVADVMDHRHAATHRKVLCMVTTPVSGSSNCLSAS